MPDPSSPIDPPCEWHILSDGERIGPFTRDALRARLEAHPERWKASVWRPGMLDWRAAESLSALTAEPPGVESSLRVPASLDDPRRATARASRNTAGELRVLSYASLKAQPRELFIAPSPGVSAKTQLDAPALKFTDEWAIVATSELRAITTSELVAASAPEPPPVGTSEWAAVATSELRAMATSDLRVSTHTPPPPPASQPASRTPTFVLVGLIVFAGLALGTSVTLRILHAYRGASVEPRRIAPPPPLPLSPRVATLARTPALPPPPVSTPPAAAEWAARRSDGASGPDIAPRTSGSTRRSHMVRPRRESYRETSAASRFRSVRVSAESAPVRVGNDNETPIVCSLSRGAVLPVLAELPGANTRWFAVRCGAQAVGWVQEKFVAPER